MFYSFFNVSLSFYTILFFFFSSRRRHTSWNCDWSSDVCSSDLGGLIGDAPPHPVEQQRQRHVVRRGELRHELPELEHEAERRPPQPGASGFAEGVKALPVEPHLAAVGYEDPGQAVQES